MSEAEASLVDRFSAAFKSLPKGLRVTLTRLAISLCVALFASAYMHLAVYLYAFRHGARMPLEGVSFIAFFGGAAGFALSLLSLFLFQYLPSEVRGFRREALAGIADRPFTWKARLLTNAMLAGAVVVAFAVMGLLSFIVSYSLAEPNDRPAILPYLISHFGLATVFSIVVMMLALNFHGADSLWQRVSLWLFVAAVVGTALLFAGSTFRDFLRTIRFGGGLTVELTLNDASKLRSCLFLISDSSMTLYDAGSASYVELQRSNVDRISYSPIEKVCELPFPHSEDAKERTPSG